MKPHSNPIAGLAAFTDPNRATSESCCPVPKRASRASPEGTRWNNRYLQTSGSDFGEDCLGQFSLTYQTNTEDQLLTGPIDSRHSVYGMPTFSYRTKPGFKVALVRCSSNSGGEGTLLALCLRSARWIAVGHFWVSDGSKAQTAFKAGSGSGDGPWIYVDLVLDARPRSARRPGNGVFEETRPTVGVVSSSGLIRT